MCKILSFLATICLVLSSRGQTLSLPSSVVEGSGTVTNGGKVSLSGVATSNVIFALESDNPIDLAVPANVTIGVGQSNATFNLIVGDNLVVDGNRSTRITATPAGFATLTNLVTIVDNDPDHIRFGAVPALTDTNAGLGLLLRAENVDGSLQTNFNLGLTVVAEGVEGLLPITPTNTGSFNLGQKFVGFTVVAPGRAVRLRALEYPGQSDPFTVIPPAFYSSTQAVADIVWVEASKTLLASVPATGGVYSNSLVAIDPATGLVTNSYPVGFDPSQIEISPGGGYLYVAISNHTALQRFDLNTRVAGLKFALGTNTNPVRFAYDFCVPPGLSDSVVVQARDQDNLGNTSLVGTFRYSSGVPTSLPSFFAAGWLVESLDSGFDVALSPGLARGNASTGAILATNTNAPGKVVTYRNGQIFDDRGNFYASGNLALLGTYPNVLDRITAVGLPEVDTVLRRVFYLAGYANFGTTFYQLKVYDRDLVQPLCQLAVPGTPASPTRFLRCGSNVLAYVTGNNQLWFVRPDATQPPAPAADLTLSFSGLPAFAVAGSNYTFTMSLSNAGPGLASIVRVTNALPSNASVSQMSPSSGTVATSSGAFIWTVANLPAGSNATLQVTLVFNSGGWQTNSTWALGFEADPVFTNNFVTLPLYVQLPPGSAGAFGVNYPSEDLLYDPVRDRLLVSVGNGGDSGPTNGLAIFNPYNGLTESFTALGKRPSKLARTDNGQFVYVSLPDDALVRRFNLSTLSQDLEFGLGSELINGDVYPFYANDLAAVPGAPQSVVAWRVRRAGPQASEFGRGVALFQNGVMASNVTASGGNWKVDFDTDSGTLFGYNSGDLRRCSLDASGISFIEQYPTFSSGGNDIEYGGGGQLFTSAGRLVQNQPFKIAWLFAGAEGAALVEPDAASGRVFYLTQNGGWQIKAYDVSNKCLLGSVSISNVIGTPSSLIRWSTNGLAFRTSSNQLFVIRSPLVQPGASADIAVALDGPVGPVPVGSNAVFTLTITNQGPGQATGLQITNRFSASVGLISASGSLGTWSTNGGVVVWTLPSMNAGTQATLSYTITSGQVGVVTATAAATMVTPDPAAGNNTAVRAIMFGSAPTIDAAVNVQLAANDMVWSPSLGKLLLSSSTNTAGWGGALVSIDPGSLAVQFCATLGSDAGRLGISRDDAVLYAGVDSGVGMLPISTLAVTNRFVINPTDPRGYAYDLKSVPGSNQVVLVGSRSRSDNSTWLGAYESGVQRSNTDFFFSTGLSLEFGEDPALLYCKDYNGNGFRRYTVSGSGISLVDSDTSLLPTFTAVDLFWGNGRLYTSVGKVINPLTRTLIGTIPNIPAGSRVRYDAGSDRIFYLCPGTNQAVLQAYDAPSLLFIDSRTIPGVSGSLVSLVRWGTDGFAFTTSSGQVFVFHSSLIPQPPADLQVTLTHSAPAYIAGSNITATITITNSGPNSATNVTWSDTLPAGTVVLNANSSTGIVSITGTVVSGAIPLLPAGSFATATVTFKGSAGVLFNQARAISWSMDPAFTNNSAIAVVWLQPSTGAAATTSLTLPVKEMERDPIRPLLYANFGSSAGALANSVAVVDPINGGASVPVPVGSDPGQMAASPDGQFLYVALDGAGSVQKLALPGLQLVSSFAVPNNQTVSRMVISPTNADMVVIRRSDGKTSLHVAGVKMPGELTDQDLFAFSENSGQLFGCDGTHSNVKMYHLNTGTNGLTLLDSQPGKQSQSTDLQSSGGLLFFNRGMVLNPDTAQVRAIMPVPNNSVVEPDAGCGRVFYLTPVGSAWTLRAFDIAQGIEVGALPSFALTSAPRKLLRWGSDGVAFYNTNSQVIILRGQLVPANPPIDVALKQSFNTLTATTNDTLNVALTLTNTGPVTASGVVVTQVFSLPVTNVVLAVSPGAATYSNNVVTWTVGNLSTGVVASATVTLRPVQSGTLNASAAAYHNLNDSFWGNNVALEVVNILNPATSNALQIRLAARELVYDSTRDLIYASTPASNRLSGNLVAMIDPASGEIKGALPAGSEPGQLAVSDDAHWLHVALDGACGVQRFNLDSGIPDLSFSFGTNDIYFAQDLEVQPNHPGTAAASLGSYNFASGFPSDVAIYDGGIARTNKGGPARGLSFASDGSYLFGYVSPGTGNGLVRMLPVPDGFQTDTVAAFTTAPGDLKFSNGRLYGFSGQVVDPFAPALIGSFGVSGPQAIDSNKGRAFSLVQKGTNWELRSFDLATLQPVSTQTVANVQGTPVNLIRCGGDRLAFRTPSNQIFIVHSQLVPAGNLAPAALKVTQQATQDFAAANETMRFIMSVTNSGPGTASNLLLAIKPPAGVASLTLQLPQGTSTNSGGNYLCNLGSLPTGQSLSVILSAVITNTSSYSNFASVSAAVPDPDLSDNTSLCVAQGVFFLHSDAFTKANISVRDLAYDPFSDRLFAGTSVSNVIVWLNPENAAVEGAISVSVTPDHLAVSDNGQYLYVCSSSTSLVQRIDLVAKAVDFSFNLPVNYPLRSALVLPGHPHALAVACSQFGGPFCAIFDEGIARTNQFANSFSLLASSEDGGTLFGYDATSTGGASPDVFRMGVDNFGLALLDTGPSDTPWGQNVSMKFSGGRLYFGNGDVLNPAGWISETPFPRFNYGQWGEINPSAGRAIFAGVPDTTAQLAVYNLSTRQQLALTTFPGVNSVASLTQCGADRVAFQSGNQIIFVRSSAIPAADVSVRGSFSTNRVMAGDSLTLHLVISNAGPYAVSGIGLTNNLPASLNILSVSASQGTFTTNGQTIAAMLGALNTNSTATVDMLLSPAASAEGWVTNLADVSGANPADPIPFNNHSAQPLLILPIDSDHDGIPDEWELAHGLDPMNPADAAQDPDGDGISNLQEFLSGTDPFVFDVLRIVSTQVDQAGFVTLRVNAAVGKTYTLENSTNLSAWNPVYTFVCGATDQVVQLPANLFLAASFYRLHATNSTGP